MISLVNDFSAILDTCVLLPIALCDFLLRLAEDPALYKPRWSREILAELERNLQGPRFGLTPEKAQYRIACMESAFPEALVIDYESLTSSMPNDPKDRHVLAAAIYGKADAIVTQNHRDFPIEQLRRLGIVRLTADEFFTHQWYLDEDLVTGKFEAQALQYKKDVRVHLALFRRTAPKFTSLITKSLGREEEPEKA